MSNKKKITLLSSESIKDSMLVFMENADFGETETLSISEIELVDETVTEGEDGAKKKAVKVRIKAIHAGRTDNQHIFQGEKLKGDEELGTGAYSFTRPYNKPMLTHHDTYQDPVGRIIAAEYVEDEKGSIEIEVLVTDPDAIEKVKDGRYNTVSIGCRTNSAKCNICGTDRLEDWCEHRRGVEYDGVVCGWVLGDLWFHECSFVNVPADKEAQTISWEEVDFEKYAVKQADEGESGIEENEKSGLGIVASEELEKTGEQGEAKEGEGSSEENGEETKPNAEENKPDTEEKTGEETGNGEQNSNENFDFEGKFAAVESELNNLKSQLSSFEQSFNNYTEAKIKEKDKEFGQMCNSIEKTSKALEQTFGFVQKLYSRLSEYVDAKVESYDLSWNIEQSFEKINDILDKIETESALQADYSMKEKNTNKGIEEKFNAGNKAMTSEDFAYRMLSSKYTKNKI